MSTDALERELAVAEALARDAGRLILEHRARGVEVAEKGAGQIVTAADLAADALLREGLARAFPADAVLSEEAPAPPERASARRLWIVDPIDATSDFAAGGDEFAVSIGLAVDGRAVLGVVHGPARGETFAGAAGLGVRVDGRPARPTEAKDLATARITVSRKEWKRGLHRFAAALPLVPTASIAYKLARVAAGLDDGTFSHKARCDWDLCGGVALVLAAGGRATLLDGSEVRFDRAEVRQPLGIVAAGVALHGPLRAALARLLPPWTG
ncbi:MAG TPA: 3'(2'),5'-bisphosphate nucleotidase CysQ [Anaeromyxobacter sp.]